MQKIDSINTSVKGLNTYEVKLISNKCPFEIDGQFPAYISNIFDKTLTSDIQLGDYIIKINGQNVSRASAKSVQRIIKKELHELCLVLSRPKVYQKTNSSVQKNFDSSPKCIRLVKKEFNSLIKCFKGLQRPNVTKNEANETMPYAIKTVATFTSIDQSEKKSVDSDDCGYFSIPRTDGSRPLLNLIDEFDDAQSTESTSMLSLNVAREERVSVDEIIQEICEKSDDFLNKIQNSIEVYVRPTMALKLVSKSQYLRLYQNMDKLIPVTKFMLNVVQLDEFDFTKLSIVFETFETYAYGLPLAIQLLEELLGFNNEFNLFLKTLVNESCALKLIDFLFLPFHFVKKICSLFNRIVDESLIKYDVSILRQMEKCLQKTDNLLNEIFCDKLDAQTELDYSDATTCLTQETTQVFSPFIEDKFMVKRNGTWVKIKVKLTNDRIIFNNDGDDTIQINDIKSVTNTNDLDLSIRVFRTNEGECTKIKFRFASDNTKRLWLNYLNF